MGLCVGCLQHSSLWARSPLFEATISSVPTAAPRLGPLLNPEVPAASPWQANTTFEEPQGVLKTPNPPEAAAGPWRGNAIFDAHLAAAMAASGPTRPMAWSQNGSFDPAADPLTMLPEQGGRQVNTPWVENGAFESIAEPDRQHGGVPQPGMSTGDANGGGVDGPMTQQLGAGQSTAPGMGLPVGAASRQSSASHQPRRSAAEVVAPGEQPLTARLSLRLASWNPATGKLSCSVRFQCRPPFCQSVLQESRSIAQSWSFTGMDDSLDVLLQRWWHL